MRHLQICIALLIILSLSCNKEELSIGCHSTDDCSILNPFSFSSYPSKDGIDISYGIRGIIDGIGNTCCPEKIEFFISDYIKMVNIHSELESVSSIQKISAGEIPIPKFLNSPSWVNDDYFEDLRLPPTGNQLILQNNLNDWFLTSFADSKIGPKIAKNVSNAQWNPHKATEVSIVERINIDAVNGITSKRLVAIDLNTASRNILHEITNPWNFNYDSLNTELYWIHKFNYSLDGEAIYFVSNKDNGATNLQEKSSYNNIWRLDLKTKEIEPLSDLLSMEIRLHDFTEDPKQTGNFYLSGYSFAIGKSATYYYNTQEKTLSLIHQIDERMLQLSIDPLGKNLLYTSNRTGEDEIWAYNLLTNQLKQITNSSIYSPLSKWSHLNWITDNEFMTLVKHDNKKKFAVFRVLYLMNMTTRAISKRKVVI